MYSIDGVPLQNPGNGWRFKRTSEPWVSRGHDRADFNASNRDGTLSVRGHVTTPTYTLVATAPGSTVERLRKLMRLGTSVTLTSDPTVVLNVEVLTLGHRTVTPAGGGVYELTAVYRVAPDVWWRDAATTDWVSTIPSSASPGSANMTVVTATTGHITDAVILLQGTIDTPRLSGSSGSWIEYSSTLTGRWLRFDTAEGRAWFGTIGDGLDPWTDTSDEYTRLVNSGAGPYLLELAPASTSDGSTLSVSWKSVGAPTTVTVRARNAYDR